MRRTAFLLSLLLLASAWQPAQSQDTPSREVTVLIAGASRAYCRPLLSTLGRIRALPGIESAEAVEAGSDVLAVRVKTSLDNDALARVFGGRIAGSDAVRVNLSVGDEARARRSEARRVITRIAAAIQAQPKPSWRSNDTEALFGRIHDIKDQLRRVGLDPAILGGIHYKAADYHIDENWYGSGGNYRIWAGDKWRGVPVFTDEYWWGAEEEGSDGTMEFDPESAFVGAMVVRNPWQSGLYWADYEGAVLNSHLGERASKGWDGTPLIHTGRKWFQDVFGALAALLARDPKRKIDELPKGRGWSIMSMLEEGGAFRRWGEPGFNFQALLLEWRQDEAQHLVARLRAYHPGHAMYLDAELDVTAAAQAYRQGPQGKNVSENEPTTIDVNHDIQWLFAAEENMEVFVARRKEAIARMDEIRTAFTAALAKHKPEELCGRLDDAELRKRLGLEFKGDESLGPGQYVVRAQLFGDIEVACGEPKVGGTRWVLFNPGSGEVIRSYQ